MATAEQHAETKVTGYTLELSPLEAGVLLSMLAGQVSGDLTKNGQPLSNIREALRSAAASGGAPQRQQLPAERGVVRPGLF